MNVMFLFNDAFNTFYLTLYGVGFEHNKSGIKIQGTR